MTQFVLADIVAIIDAHAAKAREMSERIASLERVNDSLDVENERLQAGVSEMIERAEHAEGKAEAAAAETDRAEANAAAHRDNADRLHMKLTSAGDDLNQVAALVGRLLLQHD